MTGLAEALTDPVGTVTVLVRRVDPGLEKGMVRSVVERVGGGRAKRRRLAVELTAVPSILTNGRSPGSKVVGELLLALRAAGSKRISPPRCADCQDQITTVQRRGEHWYCASCYVRPEVCASCGNRRQVAYRDRQGRPRCSKCPDQDRHDPGTALVEAVIAVDPDMPAEAITTAIETTVSKQAHVQKLAWLLHDRPRLLRSRSCCPLHPVRNGPRARYS